MPAAPWFAAILAPFLTLPVQEAATVDAIGIDPVWFRPGCLQLRCGDEEWRRETQPLALSPRQSPRLPGTRRARALSAPARPREWRGAYSNNWRVGTQYGLQLVRDGETRLGVEFGAGYRIAPLHDDGVPLPGPVFRGGITFGQRLGEHAQLSQRVQFETGNGERFAKQMLGLDVEIAEDWQLETDYVIRYDTLRTSGTETAEAWLGVRRKF